MSALASLDQSPRVRWIAMAALAALGIWCLIGLADSYFEHTFEADAQPTVAAAEAFGEAWTRPLPRPSPVLPYFDGQYWIYALGYLAAKGARALGVLDQAQVPTSQSLAVFAVRYVNLLAQVGAAVLVFHAAARLSKSALLASLLGLTFLFNPQVLAIDLMRIDRVILFLFVLVFALSLEVVRGRRSALVDVCLGVSAAALIMTKISSVIFLAIPAFAYLHQRIAFKAPPRHVVTFVAILVAASLIIDIRYVIHDWGDPARLVRNVLAKFHSVSAWGVLLSRKPYLYYNWDAFSALGPAFMWAFLAALAASIWSQVRRWHAEAGLILLSLLVLTLLGIPAYKYSRGGYVLMPLYLYVIAHGASCMRDEFADRFPPMRAWAWVFGLVMAVALLPPLYEARILYHVALLDASTRFESIRVTRIAPREWFIRNVPAGSRVAIFRDSHWADPPIFDLGYVFTPTFLNFPYLDPAAMGQFRPPDLAALPNEADVIVLNSFHRQVYLKLMKDFGHAQLARDWAEFFDALVRRYPHHEFKASHPNYGINQVDLIVLH